MTATHMDDPNTPTPDAPGNSNSDRLLGHLDPESLASRLVQAVQTGDNDPDVAAKAVLIARLDQVRQELLR